VTNVVARTLLQERSQPPVDPIQFPTNEWRSTRLAEFSSVFLRIALGGSFPSAVADRFGFWGAYGYPNSCGEVTLDSLPKPLNSLGFDADDSFSGGARSNRGRKSFRPALGSRLENSARVFVERTSSYYLRTFYDTDVGSEGTSRAFRLFSCGRRAGPGDLYKVPIEPGQIVLDQTCISWSTVGKSVATRSRLCTGMRSQLM
jgi:hypothetical protein